MRWDFFITYNGSRIKEVKKIPMKKNKKDIFFISLNALVISSCLPLLSNRSERKNKIKKFSVGCVGFLTNN